MELQSVGLLHCLLSLCLGFMLLHFCEWGPLDQNLLYKDAVDGWFCVLEYTSSYDDFYKFCSCIFLPGNRSGVLASLHTCPPRARPSLWPKQKEDLTVLSSNSWKWACLTSTGFQTTKKPDKTNSVLTSSSRLKVFVDTTVKYSAWKCPYSH